MAERPTLRMRARLQTEQGLRARKRRVLMQGVQDVALELFDEHGYDGVTIERIAGAAGVSPSTVYRHFGTKEHLILHDEYHPSIALAFEHAPEGEAPLGTLSRAIASGLGDLTAEQLVTLQRRLRYAFSVPAVNRAMLADVEEAEELIRATFARETGTAADSLELHVLVSSIGSAYRVALRYWCDHADTMALSDVVSRAFALYREYVAVNHRSPDQVLATMRL